MVKSGLEDRFHGESDVPRVSQYRLAAHLGSAFILYSLFLWSSLHHLLPAKAMEASKAALKFKRLVHFSKAFIFFTAMSGMPFINNSSQMNNSDTYDIDLYRGIRGWIRCWSSLQLVR